MSLENPPKRPDDWTELQAQLVWRDWTVRLKVGTAALLVEKWTQLYRVQDVVGYLEPDLIVSSFNAAGAEFRLMPPGIELRWPTEAAALRAWAAVGAPVVPGVATSVPVIDDKEAGLLRAVHEGGMAIALRTTYASLREKGLIVDEGGKSHVTALGHQAYEAWRLR